jgi:hypothetical protein
MVWHYPEVEPVSNLSATILGPWGNVHQLRPCRGSPGIELMKAVKVWRVEEGAIRRLPVLVRQANGCTASEKEH